MTVFITLLLAAIAAIVIIYPFFSKTRGNSPGKKAVPSKPSAAKKPQKARKQARNIDDEIEKKVRELREKNLLICPACGEKTRKGSRFCAQCGEKLEE